MNHKVKPQVLVPDNQAFPLLLVQACLCSIPSPLPPHPPPLTAHLDPSPPTSKSPKAETGFYVCLLWMSYSGHLTLFFICLFYLRQGLSV